MVTAKPSREDNPDAKGLHLAWPKEGACLLLDRSNRLGSGAVIYDSKSDGGHCAFFLATGFQPLLLSSDILELPLLPIQPTPDKKKAYLAKTTPHSNAALGAKGATALGKQRIRIWQLAWWDKGTQVNPIALSYFKLGQLNIHH